MAKYRTVKGERCIESEDGRRWTKDDGGRWTCSIGTVMCELEKRVACPGDTPDTGWYLYTNGASGGYFGEWCGRRILEAVDEATQLLGRVDLIPYDEQG